MGLDIGFVDHIEWNATRPGSAFWEHLSVYALGDGEGDRLTLGEIEAAFSDLKDAGKVDEMGIEDAEDFVNWCKEYWGQRNRAPEDGISIVLSF